MNKKAVPAAVAALVGGLVLFPEGVAHAANPACSTLIPTGSTAVYIAGSNAVEPLLQCYANEFAALTPPISIIYQKPVDRFLRRPFRRDLRPRPIPSSGNYLDTTTTPATPKSCTTGAGIDVDIGVSDVFASTCNGVTLAANQYDFLGAVSP